MQALSPCGVVYECGTSGTSNFIISPTSVGGTPIGFQPPKNGNLFAMNFVFSATTPVRYSNNHFLTGLGGGTGYKKSAGTTDTVVPCYNGYPIFIVSSSGIASVDFLFQMLH